MASAPCSMRQRPWNMPTPSSSGRPKGRFDAVVEDFKNGKLKKVYDYSNDYPDMKLVKTARRDILDRQRVQLPRGADGRSGARLSGMPVQLLSVLHAVSRRTHLQAPPARPGGARRSRASTTIACSSSTIRWHRTMTG